MPAAWAALSTPLRRPRPGAQLAALAPPALARTLAEQIAASLRDAILRGGLVPGAHLVETRIAEQMATSRGPVRDALLLLERDGLVVKLPNRGARVLDFSERSLREAATLRAALEEFAISLLVSRIGAEELAHLEAIVARLEAAARRRSVREFNELDFRFHDAILIASGHQTLHEVWRGMQRRVRAFLASSNRVNGDLRRVAERHRAILDGVGSRRASRARQEIRAHFTALHAELDRMLAARSAGRSAAPAGGGDRRGV